MAQTHPIITDDLHKFISAQPMFFVASAPLDGDGHVNLSPKGLDCLRVLSPNQVVYMDLTGSGNETSAHLLENGRITLMFCAFSGPPRILRLYGKGRTLLPDSAEWPELRPLFGNYPGVRQLILADISRVQTSCGFAVPLMDLVGQRDTLIRWAENRSEPELENYRNKTNLRSIDGLPTALAGENG